MVARVAALAAIVLASSMPAWAKTDVLMRSGAWTAIGGTSSDSEGVCGVSTGQNDRFFALKVYAGVNAFDIQMSALSWTLADGEKVGVSISFDTNTPWQGIAAGRHVSGLGILQLEVGRANLSRFGLEFRGSSLMHVEFQGNRFAAWQMALEGTQAVNTAFQNCLRTLR